MDIFFLLFHNLLPLYIIIGIGWFAGRYLDVDQVSLANLAIFICVPVVMFGFVADMDIKLSYLFLPALQYAIMAAMSFGFLHLGRFIFGDNRANLLALCTATGNTGYFGLPLVLLLVEDQWIGIYMFMMLGGIIYEGTIGYYLAARGKFNVRDSLIKLTKFPVIYALAAGIVANYAGFQMTPLFETYWEYFKGAYVIIGMMIIGVLLSRVPKLAINWQFTGVAFVGKFLIWPLFALAFVMLDRSFFNIFDEVVHKLFIIIAIVPPAANIAAFATQMDLKPEKAATTILLGTIFALFYIPAMLVLLGFY